MCIRDSYDSMNIKTKALRHEVHHVPSPAGIDFEKDGLHSSDSDLAIYVRPESGNNILIGSEDPACDAQVWVDDPDVFDDVVEVDGEFAGQVTLYKVVGGSAQFGSVGYWIDGRFAGRGIIPLAVAMVVDHAFSGLGLHRVEIAIRPENSNSLRVVEKLGAHEVGYAPRYLHIDGEWRDHRLYAITVEDVPPGGLVGLVTGS